MGKVTHTFARLLEVAALAVLVIGVAAVTSFLISNRSSLSQSVEQTPGYPPPGTGSPVPPATATLGPYPPPGQTPPPPTPWPTPTRRPGPTATAIPLPTPAPDASGVIRYTVVTSSSSTPESEDFSYAHFEIRVDGTGNVQEPSKPIELPPDLGFEPAQVIPSPDGRYSILLKAVEPGGQPYLLNPATGQVQALFETYPPGQFLGWYPDGRQFLFWSDAGLLWRVDPDILETTLLAQDAFIQGAASSPDGLRIAYIVDGWPQDTLWIVSSAGSDGLPLFEVGQQSRLSTTAWSPDGKHFVYYGSCGDPTITGPLCLADADTGARTQLNIPSFAGGAVTWSPNGQYIAATGLVPGDPVCGAKVQTLLEQEACQFDEGRMVYLTDTQTGVVQALASGRSPVWAPDGSMLAFVSNRTGSAEIWTIRINGDGLTQLTSDGQTKTNLSWSRETAQ